MCAIGVVSTFSCATNLPKLINCGGMVPIHVTVRHGINECHTMAWYQCGCISMIAVHVTL